MNQTALRAKRNLISISRRTRAYAVQAEDLANPRVQHRDGCMAGPTEARPHA